MNRITVRSEQDGSQTWANTDADTGEVIQYRFVPASTIRAGDRLEEMRQFTATRGTKRAEPAHVLTGPEATELVDKGASVFVRVSELAVDPSDLHPASPVKGGSSVR